MPKRCEDYAIHEGSAWVGGSLGSLVVTVEAFHAVCSAIVGSCQHPRQSKIWNKLNTPTANHNELCHRVFCDSDHCEMSPEPVVAVFKSLFWSSRLLLSPLITFLTEKRSFRRRRLIHAVLSLALLASSCDDGQLDSSCSDKHQMSNNFRHFDF